MLHALRDEFPERVALDNREGQVRGWITALNADPEVTLIATEYRADMESRWRGRVQPDVAIINSLLLPAADERVVSLFGQGLPIREDDFALWRETPRATCGGALGAERFLFFRHDGLPGTGKEADGW